MGAVETTKQLRALAALLAVLNSVPSNYMVAHKHLYWDLMPSSVIVIYTDRASLQTVPFH